MGVRGLLPGPPHKGSGGVGVRVEDQNHLSLLDSESFEGGLGTGDRSSICR